MAFPTDDAVFIIVRHLASNEGLSNKEDLLAGEWLVGRRCYSSALYPKQAETLEVCTQTGI